MDIIKRLAILFAFISAYSNCYAEIKVIVHPSSTVTASANEIVSLFLGKTTKIGGAKMEPLDQEEGEATRDEFYLKVAKKDAAQLKAYWSRLIFTGKGQPPESVFDDDEVISTVEADSNVVGYVGGDADTSSVKVLLTVK